MVPLWLTHATEAWASVYANHAALRTGLGFAHVGGLLTGGGSALAADLGALRLGRTADARRAAYLTDMAGTHRVVLSGLSAVIVSGIMLAAADLDTFLPSRLFWTKMALVLLLAINGAALMRVERMARAGNPRGWQWLPRAAVASLALWLLTTLAGSALPNLG